MILVGGDFTNLGKTNRNRMGRLDGSGVIDPVFNPNASFSSSVYAMVFDGNGMIVVGGTFTSIGGANRNRMARLDPITGLADSFHPDVDGDVMTLALQPDGKIVVGGFFNNVGGEPRNYIARIDGTTGLADGFNPGANSTVQTVVLQADGKILAGGGFTSMGSQPRGRMARVDGVTGQVDSFNPGAGGAVSTIALQADGKFLAGGSFTTMSTQPRGRIARFAVPPPVFLGLEKISATRVTMSWPTNATGYTLESKTDLNLDNNYWYMVFPFPVVSGTNYVVTNTITGSRLFYRLRK